jgi:GNAT superfamily N-acetyltransferase
MQTYKFRLLDDPPSEIALGKFLKNAQWPTTKEQIHQIKNYTPNPNLKSNWIVASINNQDIAICTFYAPKIQLAIRAPVLIANFVVIESHQRKKVGVQLLREVQIYCQLNFCDKLILQATKSSINFWLSQGFLPNPAYPKNPLFLLKLLRKNY